ncbi:MAG: hypothetical protein ACI4AB_04900 [Acetatifactor sp.]
MTAKERHEDTADTSGLIQGMKHNGNVHVGACFRRNMAPVGKAEV